MKKGEYQARALWNVFLHYQQNEIMRNAKSNCLSIKQKNE